jgi:hypothetical protein
LCGVRIPMVVLLMLFVAKILWGTKVKIFCRPSVKLSWYEVCKYSKHLRSSYRTGTVKRACFSIMYPWYFTSYELRFTLSRTLDYICRYRSRVQIPQRHIHVTSWRRADYKEWYALRWKKFPIRVPFFNLLKIDCFLESHFNWHYRATMVDASRCFLPPVLDDKGNRFV